jgi:signal transduction histidine kinase
MPSWWRRHATVRLQTTLVAVVVTGAALFLGAFLVLRSVRGDIRARVQRQVRAVAGQVAKQMASGLAPQGFVFASSGEGFVPPSVRVVDLETGQTVAQIAPALPGVDPGAGPSTSKRFVVGVEPPGIGSAAVPANAITQTVLAESPVGRYEVLAWSPSSIVSANTAALETSLAAGFPALALLVGMITWMLTGRSLRPVEEMRAQVEEISAHTLDRRVPEPATADEIGRLAHTMNGMLDRLESASHRQREFVSDASHELRSPIAAIRSQLEVALHDPGHAEWMSVAAGTLAENERLERLVDDLLTLARLDEGRVPAVEDVDLDDVVREEVARLRDGRIRLAVEPVRVRGNREQIARAIRNLLENAARFARDRIDVVLTVESETAVVTVSDDGPGIVESERERVFERFTRLDEGRARTHGGVGLGLALVRGIAVAHGGTAEAADPVDGGARLVMRLPRTAG